MENPGTCGGHSVCENTLGGYKCVCAAGYRGNGTHCEGKQTSSDVPPREKKSGCGCDMFVSVCVSPDENECASGAHGCDPNARCGNIIGSYFCQCYQGFNGDGRSCFGGLPGDMCLARLSEGQQLKPTLWCQLWSKCLRIVLLRRHRRVRRQQRRLPAQLLQRGGRLPLPVRRRLPAGPGRTQLHRYSSTGAGVQSPRLTVRLPVKGLGTPPMPWPCIMARKSP